MKNKEEIKKSIGYGEVFTLQEFKTYVKSGFFIPYDGSGVLHNGECETNISVWDIDIFDKQWDKYPFVCWYNK